MSVRLMPYLAPFDVVQCCLAWIWRTTWNLPVAGDRWCVNFVPKNSQEMSMKSNTLASAYLRSCGVRINVVPGLSAASWPTT